MKSKYPLRDYLNEEEVLALLGVFTEKDLEELKQTRIYKHWEKTGRIEYSDDKYSTYKFKRS